MARLTGKYGGIQDLHIAEYPGPIGIHDSPQIKRNIESALMSKIVGGLTGSESETVSTRKHSNARDIVFSGTQAAIQRYFDEQKWSDGLPIISPTIELIEQFLQFTDREADDTVAILQAANLRATPWNIAANAIMAGCSPEHMPILFAAVEALGDERCSLNNIGSSSGIFPFILVNGPIVDELGIHSGAQLVSQHPNPVLGRAVGLIVRNIGGFRSGLSYMGTFGYPLAFALAERADESPWEPFHVSQGFAADANTVTVGVTNNWGASPAPYDRPGYRGAEVALELLSRQILKKTRLFNFPGRGSQAETVMITLLLSPSVARSLAGAGYSKEDVKKHLYENTRMSIREFDWICKFTSVSGNTSDELVREGVLPPEFEGKPDEQVRILSSPDVLHIVVCGDPHRNRVMVMEGGHTQPTTKAIAFPRNWTHLRTRSST